MSIDPTEVDNELGLLLTQSWYTLKSLNPNEYSDPWKTLVSILSRQEVVDPPDTMTRKEQLLTLALDGNYRDIYRHVPIECLESFHYRNTKQTFALLKKMYSAMLHGVSDWERLCCIAACDTLDDACLLLSANRATVVDIMCKWKDNIMLYYGDGDEILNININVRTLNALRRAGIYTCDGARRVVQNSSYIRGIGSRGLEELRRELL